MRILGIHFNDPHASLCLVEDGRILCAIKEESISRKPDDESFPELALQEIQKKYQISLDVIDHVVIAYKPIRKIEDFITGEMLAWPSKLQGFPKRLNQCLLQQFNLSKALKKYFGPHRDIIFLDSFLSLAAYEYSPNRLVLAFLSSATVILIFMSFLEMKSISVNQTTQKRQIKHLLNMPQ